MLEILTKLAMVKGIIENHPFVALSQKEIHTDSIVASCNGLVVVTCLFYNASTILWDSAKLVCHKASTVEGIVCSIVGSLSNPVPTALRHRFSPLVGVMYQDG